MRERRVTDLEGEQKNDKKKGKKGDKSEEVEKRQSQKKKNKRHFKKVKTGVRGRKETGNDKNRGNNE